MSAPKVIPPGGGEVVGDTPDRRVEILCEDDALHATWSRFGPRREGADLHIHRHHTDLFYVLEGELTARLGVEDEQVALPEGTLARLPPYVVHGFRNASDADVRYLNLHAPGQGFAAYMRGIRDRSPVPFDQEDPPAEGLRPASDAAITSADPGAAGTTVLAEIDGLTVAHVRCEPGDTRTLGAAPVTALYVLEGELALGEAGSWLQVAGGEVTLAPASDAPVRVLAVRAGGGQPT